MKKEFFTYFLKTYVVLLLPMASIFTTSPSLSWKEKLGWFFLIPFIIALFLTPLFYWLTPKLKTYHRRKKTKKKLFKAFIDQNDFKTTTDGMLHGRIDDYIIFLQANYDEFQYTKWIEIQVLFHPKQRNQYISQSLLQRLQRKYEEKNVTWHANSILIKKIYALRMPKYEVVYPLLKQCISELKAQNIAPISYTAWTAMLPEVQQYYNNLEKL
ncbi:hypothetical protein [Kordia sp.]|uniref:hypothetical protein n=1 Tax=Kordia sp. TaxID=1965332 RepID=UPI003B5C08E8